MYLLRTTLRALAEWSASGGQPPARAEEVSVVRLIARFREHSKTYYRRPDGTPTGTAENFKPVLKVLRELYEGLLVSEFGPRQLKALRQSLIENPAASRPRF